MVVFQASIITKAKVADVIATGAMVCQMKIRISEILFRLSSTIAVLTNQISAMIIWTEKRPKYHPFYLAGMVQMDSRSSSGCSFLSAPSGPPGSLL